MTRILSMLPAATLAALLVVGGVACNKGQQGGEAAAPKGEPAAKATKAPAGEKKAEEAKPAAEKKAQPATRAAAEAAKKAAAGEKPAKAEGNFGKTDEKVKVEFYVMSQCPFGVRVEDAISPVLQKMGANIDFHLDFIADVLPDGNFKSLHGEKEVKGNIAQLCAVKHHPDSYMKLVDCMNKNMRAIPGNWEQCATTAGMDMPKMKACFEGDEGKDLLKTSIAKAKARAARGSPTMFVADKRYSGGRSEASFMRAICNEFKGTKPEACASLPEPLKFQVTILTDQRCKECRTKPMEARLKGMFEGAQIKTVDYNTDEGKKLYADLGVKLLPVFLFEKTVEKAEGYKQVQRYMTPQGEYLSLRVGAKFDPTAEICDNGKDDTGNGKVDCDDPTCAQKLTCRKEEQKRLDLFVMSQCPYGVKALDAMKEVLEAFKGDVNFNIHFIAQEKGEGFTALHGQPEVDENIRELCAIKHYPKAYKYMDYVWCRNKNIRSANWQECTGGKTGIDTKVIEKCFAGDEGKQLLRDSIKVTNALGFSASPTWLANNKFKFSGISAEQIKQSLCRYNKGLKGCDQKLSDDKTTKGSCG